MRPDPKNWPAERIARLRHLRQQVPALSSIEIGEELGCSATTIQYAAKRFELGRPALISEDWPEADMAQMRDLWLRTGAEFLSAREIGRRMGGRSKNAIVGKVRRMGLPARPSPIGKGCSGGVPRKRRPKLPPPEIPTVVPLAFLAEPAPPEPAPEPRPLVARTPPMRGCVTCEYPMWGKEARPVYRFCDKPVLSYRYCDEHNRIAYPRMKIAQAA